MPNITISDLPLAIIPLDITTVFFEVQTVEGGVDVSRRVRGDMITFNVFPPPTADYTTVRGNLATGLFVESTLLQIDDGTGVVRVSGAGALQVAAGTTVEEPTPIDGMIRYDTDTNVYRGVVSGAWADLGGGGGAQISGTPVDNQLAVWVDATDIEGDSNLTWDGTDLVLTGAVSIDMDDSASNDNVVLSMRNSIGGSELSTGVTAGWFTLIQTTAAGAFQKLWLRAVRDADIKLYFNGGETANTLAGASGGFQVLNTLTGGGFERVLTTSDLGGGATALDDLSDVTIATPSTGALFAKSSGDWLNFNDLLWTDASKRLTLQGSASPSLRLTATTGLNFEVLSFGTQANVGFVGVSGISLFDTGNMNVGSATAGKVTVRMGSVDEITFQANGTNDLDFIWDGTDFNIHNREIAGGINLQGRRSGGQTTKMLDLDPDTGADFFEDGVSFLTLGKSLVAFTADATADAIWDLQARNPNNDMILKVRTNQWGGLGIISADPAENVRLVQLSPTGAIEDDWIVLTQDGGVALFNNDVEVARTLTTASGGFEVNNADTGGGFERVLTESDLEPAPAISDVTTQMVTGTTTISALADYSGLYFKTNTTAVTLQVDESTDASLLGKYFVVSNEGSSADITVTKGGGAIAFNEGASTPATIVVAPDETKMFIRYLNNSMRVVTL